MSFTLLKTEAPRNKYVVKVIYAHGEGKSYSNVDFVIDEGSPDSQKERLIALYEVLSYYSSTFSKHAPSLSAARKILEQFIEEQNLSSYDIPLDDIIVGDSWHSCFVAAKVFSITWKYFEETYQNVIFD